LVLLTVIANEVGTHHIIVALVVFILTFTLITTEKLPNAIAAMVGAFIVITFHILTQDEAIKYVDFDTIGLLCGMMIIVAIMRRSGLFEYIAIKGIKITEGNPWRLLVVLSTVTAVLSAFLDNVTTVLIIVPLTLAVSDTIKINPLPLLISEIIFSNLGGTATLIGDPPNIMIGGATHLGFMDFILNNLPVVIVVSIVTFYLLRLTYYKKLISVGVDKEKINAFDEKRAIKDKRFFIKNLVIFSLVILSFITHQIHGINIASLALGGSFILMMITRQEPLEILKEVEWPTLFFFMGLFVIVGGLEETGIIGHIADVLTQFTKGRGSVATQLVLWMSALSTSFINSIPYTATMISVVENMGVTLGGNVDPLWWGLSLGACFGGNGTIIGAAANIVVAGFTQKTSYPLKFIEYLKVGIPIMLVSVLLASVYLHLRYFLF
jgi:Na+/H+ antiporter NhaD/arsenite permease-like protein